MAKRLCYARPTRRSWLLKQRSMRDISQLKEDLEQKITTWQREVDLKLMKSVWGAQVRTPEEDELPEEGVCESPRVCLCCHRPPDTVKRDLSPHPILLRECFAVCQENHTRLKLEKCEFMQETMQYPGFDIGYGWWTPAASKAKPLMDAKVRHDDPSKKDSMLYAV